MVLQYNTIWPIKYIDVLHIAINIAIMQYIALNSNMNILQLKGISCSYSKRKIFLHAHNIWHLQHFMHSKAGTQTTTHIYGTCLI